MQLIIVYIYIDKYNQYLIIVLVYNIYIYTMKVKPRSSSIIRCTSAAKYRLMSWERRDESKCLIPFPSRNTNCFMPHMRQNMRKCKTYQEYIVWVMVRPFHIIYPLARIHANFQSRYVQLSLHASRSVRIVGFDAVNVACHIRQGAKA